AAGTKLLILCRNRLNNIAGGYAETGHSIRLQPDSHREVRGAHDRCVVRPGDTLKCVQHVEVGVITDILRIVASIWRIDANDHEKNTRTFAGLDTAAPHGIGQQWYSEIHPVLYLNLRFIRIGTNLEGY